MNNFETKIMEYVKKVHLDDKLNLKKDFKIEFLAQGEYNINYILEDNTKKFVFRINTASQLRLKNQINYEFNALKFIEKSTVTPTPIYVDGTKEFFDFGLLIMNFIKGRPLNYSTDLEIAADIFSKIHSINTKDNTELLVENNILNDRINEATWMLEDFFKSSIPDKKLKNFFHNYLNWCNKNLDKEKYFIENNMQVVNNTEVNSHNFLIDKKSYLIDWEKPVISHPCQDLTQFFADTTTLWRSNYLMTKEEKDFFIDKYCEKTQFNINDIKESINIYNPYLYLRALSWCAMAFVQYADSTKLIKNEEIFKKIISYLDFSFLEKLLKPYDII